MGTVYRAQSAKDADGYAIKIVPRRNVINLKSIGEKVAALKQVRHPRVSAMMQVGAQGDRVYMVWPLLEGGEKLDAVVARQGQLPPRQAAQVALQVASGLQAYHEHELFHGLLKPSDVLIGSDRRVRLLDFGVGFLLTCERGKALLDTTTNGKALARGLDCASPESIMDPLDRSPRGDQYSLGCILYFCLAGRYPFPTSNPVKKMMGHQFEEPTPIERLVPGSRRKAGGRRSPSASARSPKNAIPKWKRLSRTCRRSRRIRAFWKRSRRARRVPTPAAGESRPAVAAAGRKRPLPGGARLGGEPWQR